MRVWASTLDGTELLSLITPLKTTKSTTSPSKFKPESEKTLNFAGTGVSDALGTTIDNVRLLRECGCGFEDLVVNGEFHEAVWVDQSWRYFYEGIRGWKGKELEIGNGRYYNKRLPQNNPVTELDAAQNVDIVQTIYLDESFRKVAHYIGTPSVVAWSWIRSIQSY